MATPVLPMENPTAAAPPKAVNEPKNESIQSKRQIKSTLKRLMVPELPEPHHHDILLHQPEETVEQPLPAAVASNTPSEVAATVVAEPPNKASNLSDLQVALHPKQDTSLWVLITVAILILAFAAILLLVIIFK